jgi:outer membrane protein OmpA-like peptidoglycan-associated protein
MAEIIRKYPENRLVIVGHTDSQGSEAFNRNLSEQRANAVRSLIVANGVPAAHVQTQGAGESQPVADNNTASGRALNRRVEIAITMVEAPQTTK